MTVEDEFQQQEHGPPVRASDDAPADEAPADQPVKRGRGRPKGQPKTGGRQKGQPTNVPPAETVAAILGKGDAYTAAFERLLDIGLGRPITQTGPTGKTFKAPAPVAIQFNALSNIVSRLVPEQRASSVAIDATAKVELKTKPEPSPRELARVILNIFHKAGLESEAGSIPLLARVAPMLDHVEQ